METRNKDDQSPLGSKSIESTQNADKNAFGDFITQDGDSVVDHHVTDDPRQKKEKDDQYFDDKENPRTHYNVNDQAHSQSSKEDFVKTVSNFKHSDGSDEADNDYPEQVPD